MGSVQAEHGSACMAYAPVPWLCAVKMKEIIMARRGENIYHRKDGRWEARYIRSYEGGKARYGYLYARSYGEAKAKKAAVSARQGAEKPKPSAGQMDFDGLCELWLSGIRTAVKESSYTRYVRSVRSYLHPILGELPLEQLDQSLLDQVPERLRRSGGLRQKALSPKTVCDILSVLKAVIRFGNEKHYLALDPKGIRSPQKQKPCIAILPEKERIRIEEQLMCSEDPVSLGILFTLFTGVRIGELCGLRWGDIDFATGIASIRRTVERIADLDPLSQHRTKVVVGEPKTGSSIRSIPLPGFLVEYLEKRRGPDHTYLLTGREQFSEPHHFYMRYRRYMKALGMEGYTFHALRHTFATRCVALGFDLKSLSEILGHADVTTTLSVYVHPTLAQKQQMMERLTCSRK